MAGEHLISEESARDPTRALERWDLFLGLQKPDPWHFDFANSADQTSVTLHRSSASTRVRQGRAPVQDNVRFTFVPSEEAGGTGSVQATHWLSASAYLKRSQGQDAQTQKHPASFQLRMIDAAAKESSHTEPDHPTIVQEVLELEMHIERRSEGLSSMPDVVSGRLARCKHVRKGQPRFKDCDLELQQHLKKHRVHEGNVGQ